jgi:acyl-CoA synthetase (AMP-forming)/AMP-acid ligase II
MATASRFAARLSDTGVRKGDVCAIIIRHHRDFYPLYLGVSATGALPSVLAYPNPRLHPDKFREGLVGMAKRSGLDWILTEAELESQVAPLTLMADSTVRGILKPLEWRMTSGDGEAIFGYPAVDPGEPCLLQHSSGTTGLQKAVMLSHRAVLEHVRRYSDSIRLAGEDKIASWLPLYHDMGLIAAFYVPLTAGVPIIQIDPFEWVKAPVLLLEAISEEKATLTWLPNFAYNLLADRVHEEDLEGLSLESVRMLINCSEPVRAESHDRFYRRFSPYGLRKEALGACYAMAETTFAVTQTSPGVTARELQVDREKLSRGIVRVTEDVRRARVCVSSGGEIPACNVRIVGESGKDLPEDIVGEIAIRSTSLFSGYRNNPEKTAEVLKEGWFYSGDYGFRHEGEYFVIGRKKDIIIVAGKNVYPEDIEDAIGQVKGVIPGRVVAFGVEDAELGTEQICVVAETAVGGEKDKKSLRAGIVEAGMQMDITISRVHLAPPRWLIKSSAGKPSRKANKERALALETD